MIRARPHHSCWWLTAILILMSGGPGAAAPDGFRLIESPVSIAILGPSVDVRLSKQRAHVTGLRIDPTGQSRFGADILEFQPQPMGLFFGGFSGALDPESGSPQLSSQVKADPPEIRQTDDAITVRYPAIKYDKRTESWEIRVDRDGFSWTVTLVDVDKNDGAPFRLAPAFVVPAGYGDSLTEGMLWPAEVTATRQLIDREYLQGLHIGFVGAEEETFIIPPGEHILHLVANRDLGGDLKLTSDRPLYRVGNLNQWTVIGAGPELTEGQSSTLRIEPVPALAYGRQLDLGLSREDLPPGLADDLATMFDGFWNGGALTDPVVPTLGNQPGGFFFSLTAYTYSFALLSSRSANEPGLSGADAVRGYVSWLLGQQREDGALLRGGIPGQSWENEASTLIAAHNVAVHDRNVAWVRAHADAIGRAVAYLQGARGERGLLWNQAVDANTSVVRSYWDTLDHSGASFFTNVLVWKALIDSAELFRFINEPRKARSIAKAAKALRRSILAAFWRDTLYEHGGFIDHITLDGTEHAHLMTAGPMLAIAWGFVGEERAGAVFRSIEARLSALETEHAWCGWGLPASLYDAHERIHDSFRDEDHAVRFGSYMNGGILPEWTGWELIARARLGQHEVIARRLKAWQQAWQEHRFYVGSNSFSIDGSPNDWIGEPFLSTQVMLPAAVAWAASGAWPSLTAEPSPLPPWPGTSATVSMGR